MRVQRAVALFCVCATLVLSACASVMGEPIASPPVLRPDATSMLVLGQTTNVSVSTFYSRTLRAGTHWKYFGSLPQGDIYRPVDTVLTVESGNVQEAYLVLSGANLVGYYLPVEKNYSKIDSPVVIDFKPAS